MSELRKDLITGRWVIIHKEGRRTKKRLPSQSLAKPKDEKDCPFCPESISDIKEKELLSYRDQENRWSIRVVPDKFPIVDSEGELDKEGVGVVYDRMNSIGSHEIIIESPMHDQTLDTLPYDQLEKLIWAYKERFLKLKENKTIKHILIVKNYGKTAGGLVIHPHSQLIALPIIPKSINEELAGSKKYFGFHQRCVYCDIIYEELRKPKERIIFNNNYFISLVPFAPRFSYETWILPCTHNSSFENISDQEIKNLASILKDTLTKIKINLNNPGYNLILHSGPLKENYLPEYHWHIEIMPKLYRSTGYEWGSGVYINYTFPEKAAQLLRR
ncbi:MAG: DUF4931 domain-containing protein [bacterium]|nr:DUF4931 domain-containing protein [bacterium]